VIGLFKMEVIHYAGSWNGLDATGLVTLGWERWFARRMAECYRCGGRRPDAAEAASRG
jgi:hypothetical protein